GRRREEEWCRQSCRPVSREGPSPGCTAPTGSGPVVISGILIQPSCTGGEPGWRNGRRGALKMRCPRGRAGSSPAPGTDIAAPPECQDDHAGGALRRRSVRLGQRLVDHLDEEVC